MTTELDEIKSLKHAPAELFLEPDDALIAKEVLSGPDAPLDTDTEPSEPSEPSNLLTSEPSFDIPTDLLSVAASLGITEDEARKYPSVHRLQEHVYLLADYAQRRQANASAPASAPSTPSVAPTEAFEELKLEMGEDLDDSVRGPLKALADYVNVSIKKLAATVGGSSQAFQSWQEQAAQQRDAEVRAQFDAGFPQMEASLHGFFGNGSKTSAQQAAARREVFDLADGIARTHLAKHGRLLWPLEDYRERAAYAWLGNRAKDLGRNELEAKLDRSAGKMIARTGSVKGAVSAKDAEERAIEKIDKMLKGGTL